MTDAAPQKSRIGIGAKKGKQSVKKMQDAATATVQNFAFSV